MSQDDMRAMSIWENSIRLTQCQDGPHYELALPYRQGDRKDVKFPDQEACKKMAQMRMTKLKSKFMHDPEAFKMCCEQVDQYLERGHARVVPEDEQVAPPGRPQWYLPIHCVKNPNKPGKVCATFDAKATVGGISLNDELLSGPDLANKLLGVLICFRQELVMLQADIEGMFNAVKVAPEDAYCFCFWF